MGRRQLGGPHHHEAHSFGPSTSSSGDAKMEPSMVVVCVCGSAYEAGKKQRGWTSSPSVPRRAIGCVRNCIERLDKRSERCKKSLNKARVRKYKWQKGGVVKKEIKTQQQIQQ